jgi:H/ACA ribonucleoprotein complex subunit 4
MMNAPEPAMGELLECSFILLDKPAGPSSHEVTAYVKKLLGARKTGHAGTLDPQVSGVLVIGLNRATRLIRFITAKDKAYVGVLRLRKPPAGLAKLQAEMDRFVGNISQMPPKMSAVAKRWRQRKVYEYKAQELVQNTALFTSRVEAGTYVRVLCSEVGKPFGGGRMLQLRRTAVGETGEKDLVRLPQLADALWLWKHKGEEGPLRAMLVPADKLIRLPHLTVKRAALDAVCRGAPLAISGVADAEAGIREGGLVLAQAENGRLIGIFQMLMDIQKARNGNPNAVVAKSKVVLAAA